EVQVKAYAQRGTPAAVLGSFRSRGPADHQARAGEDAALMSQHDTLVDTRALSEVVRVYDEKALRGHDLDSQVLQQAGQHGFGPEVFFGDAPGSPGVTVEVGADGLPCLQDLIHGVKR